ncbi:hypothetical protein [Paenibacillus sp. GCM10012303]|uniref:hypothetical protein n=1 Tax=Paenibacillus sp. GCM10012303 TaxID=3317340 RepID=UPI00361D1CE1
MVIVPAAHTVFHKDRLAHEAARLYEIGTPRSSRFVSNGLNDTYSIATNTGIYYVRIYKFNWRSESSSNCCSIFTGSAFPFPYRCRDGTGNG